MYYFIVFAIAAVAYYLLALLAQFLLFSIFSVHVSLWIAWLLVFFLSCVCGGGSGKN